MIYSEFGSLSVLDWRSFYYALLDTLSYPLAVAPVCDLSFSLLPSNYWSRRAGMKQVVIRPKVSKKIAKKKYVPA